MQRTIYLPAICRSITLAQYCAAFRIAKINPDRRFRQTFQDWNGGTGADIVREFRRGMHDRINAGSYRMAEGWRRAGACRTAYLPPKPRGRKDCSDYVIRARRDARAISVRVLCRVRVYQFETEEARRRFGHLLSSYHDD